MRSWPFKMATPTQPTLKLQSALGRSSSTFAPVDRLSGRETAALPSHSTSTGPGSNTAAKAPIYFNTVVYNAGVFQAIHGSAGLSSATMEFMRALPRATLATLSDDCSLLTLPLGADGTPISWPGYQSKHLFIRPCFVDFYENPALLNRFALSASGGWSYDTLLRGAPGIGKSSFGLYVLWRMVMEGRSVIYDYPRGVDGGTELKFGAEPFAACITDGVAARHPDVPTLLISGTSLVSAGIHNQFLKRPRRNCVYMPKPTTTELHLLRTTCFPEVSAETASALAQRCGNRPRQVLAHAIYADEHLRRDILATQMPALMKLVRTQSEQVALNEVTLRIVDYVISPDFSEATLGWASPWIERRVIANLCALDGDASCWLLLQEMLTGASLNGLRMARALFEDWCDTVLREGSAQSGGFRIRQLGVGSMDGEACYAKEKEEQAKLSSLLCNSCEALHIRRDGDSLRWDVPRADKSAVLAKADYLPEHEDDSAVPVRWRASARSAAAGFVQVAGTCSMTTVSLRHDLILQGKEMDSGLSPVLQRLDPPALTGGADVPVPFLWLVPSLHFSDFSARPMTVSAASQDKPDAEAEVPAWKAKQAAAKVARALGRRVVQYAVEIPDPRHFGAPGKPAAVALERRFP